MECILNIYHNKEKVNTIIYKGEKAKNELLKVYHTKIFIGKVKMWEDQTGCINAVIKFLSTENEVTDYYYTYEYTFNKIYSIEEIA